MAHDGERMVAAVDERDERVPEKFVLRDAPRVASRNERRHQRRVEGRRMVGTYQQSTGAWNVLEPYHAEEAGQVDVDQGASQRTHKCVDHVVRYATCLRISSTTCSTSRLSVSIKTASDAGRSGATARSVSTRSRSATSLRMASSSTRSPR